MYFLSDISNNIEFARKKGSKDKKKRKRNTLLGGAILTGGELISNKIKNKKARK